MNLHGTAPSAIFNECLYYRMQILFMEILYIAKIDRCNDKNTACKQMQI